MSRKYKRFWNILSLMIACAFINVIAVTAAVGADVCTFSVMPLGDSITKGTGSSDLSGYRKELYNQILPSYQYDTDFVGSLKDGPVTFDNDHEGHGGFTASEIADQTFLWLKNNPADVILLHAGTNNLSSSPSEVERILDEIDRFSNDSWVILSLIINRNPYSSLTSTFNSNLLDMAQRRIAAGDKIIVVDQENALIYSEDMSDSLHPNDAGYSKMTQVWADGLEPLLNNLCSGPPEIVDSIFAPVLQGFIGVPYSYVVKAYGEPRQNFILTEAPAGMIIDRSGGLITWTPTASGSFDVTVEVSNSSGSDTQSFVIEVTDPNVEYIIDNDDPGTTASGTWVVSSGANPYGADSLYSKTVSNTYTFEAARSGLQAVYLWWTYFDNRSSSVPVKIYDGVDLIGTLKVNQLQNGGRWNLLGQYEFTGQARVVIVADSSTKTTSADAVKFVPVAAATPKITSSADTHAIIDLPYSYDVEVSGSQGIVFRLITSPIGMIIDPVSGLITWTPTSTGFFDVTVEVSNSSGSDTQSFVIEVTDPDVEYIIDNDDPGTTASGTWSVSSGPDPYGTESLYSKTVSSTYSFEAARSGLQAVYLWWTYFDNRSSSVPVKIYDGVDLIGTLKVNQLQNGGRWNLIGEYEFTGQARVVIVADSSTKTTSADAVKFVPVVVPAALSTIVDNGDPGTTASGNWSVSAGPNPYNTDSLYSKISGDTYRYEAAVNGSAAVSLWWTYYDNRCTEVPVDIYDGTNFLETQTVNQKMGGGSWVVLGSYNFHGMARVLIKSTGGCTTSADAVRWTPKAY